MREFNTTGTCVPWKHYMVDISAKTDQIVDLICRERYFTMNRARQYGKTTTLAAVYRQLKETYLVLRLSFEGLGTGAFRSDMAFVRVFIRRVGEAMEFAGELPSPSADAWNEAPEEEAASGDAFDYLSRKITRLCRESRKEIILMIDEVDKASDNQVFLNFLGMLRDKYLKREEGMDATFKSVILAGVYDVKNLKLRIRPEEERKYNSPWNIAVDFEVDMSFSPEEIATMLSQYEEDHHTGMKIGDISREIYFYTGGYPFLVSLICKRIDEDRRRKWQVTDVGDAVKEILKTRNTLFDDLIKNVENHSDLKKLVTGILCDGISRTYSRADPTVDLGVMFGILAERDHMAALSNVMFETYLYDYLIAERNRMETAPQMEKNQFVADGRLDMPQILLKFREFMRSEYRREDEAFLERQGRLLFLCFLKPIINGVGHYYVEPETRDSRRMDVVVCYGREEYIIELKIWRGEKYRDRGLDQLRRYMDSRQAKEGYLVSFVLSQTEESGGHWILPEDGAGRIFEVRI